MNLKLNEIRVRSGLKSKEYLKYDYFISFLEHNFELNKYHTIYDLCCGKGIIGLYFAELNFKVTSMDIKARNQWLNNSNREYITKDIYEDIALEDNCLVTGIHACGSLTDRIIELALISKNDFAVMSCCHNDKIYFSPKKSPDQKIIDNFGRDVYLDQLRLNYVLEQEYIAGITKIPKIITPKNRIIWGKIID